MIDKFYFIKGGAERYYFELKDVLESHGHEVIPFSMKHPRNEPTPYESYFVDQIDFNPTGIIQKIITGIRSFGRIVYSRQAQKRIRKLIRETRPDIAHLHMIDHQISPSILPVLKAEGIPVIQTIHTYKHVCPSYRLYLMDKNEICERCLGGNYFHVMTQKCHKNSFIASSILFFEMTLHKWMRLFEKYLDLYHVPSHFMGAKLIEGGIPKEKVKHLFYTIRVDKYPVRYDSDDYFLYYGRLSEEKGLDTLLKAMKNIPEGHLKIVGEGPYRKTLEQSAKEMGLENVEFTGPIYGDALKSTVSGAQFVVVPSEWYENSPLVIYESLSMGKPVIGARSGGIPELIENGVDGMVFEAGNVDELRHCIKTLLGDKKSLPDMGKAARKKAETEFDFVPHYEKMMALYEGLIRKGTNG